jgi:hypothetical protein
MDKVDIPGPSSVQGMSLAGPLEKNNGISFIVLNLYDNTGKRVSHNVYWYSAANDFTALNSMPQTTLSVKPTGTSQSVNEKRWSFTISNTSDKIAFFINPRLMSGDEEVTPSFWSANYFTLAPGETMDVTVGCPPEKITGGAPVLRVEGWNIKETEIKLQ